jgi:hypothetical protein
MRMTGCLHIRTIRLVKGATEMVRDLVLILFFLLVVSLVIFVIVGAIKIARGEKRD